MAGAHDRTTPERGHRAVAHTADVILEAWGPDLAACCEEAVAALVGVYAAGWSDEPARHRLVHLAAASPRSLLLDVLDEVIFALDTSVAVPVGATVTGDTERGLDVDIHLVPRAAVEPAGAGPKAVSRSGLAIDEDDSGFRCEFLVDV